MNGFDARQGSAHMRMVRLVGNGKRVLEVGCGSGFVSEQLKRNGCTVTGIELDPERAAMAKKFCSKILIGNVEEMALDFPKESFDVILFGDVLEHLFGPEAVLRKVRPFLAEGGLLVASIPNVANWKIRLLLLKGSFDYTDWGILDRTHMRFFTRKSAKSLIEKAGFDIVAEEFVPSFPFPCLKSRLAGLNRSWFSYQFIFAAKKGRLE